MTVYLISAVLRPPPWDKLAELQLLNPYNEQITMGAENGTGLIFG